MAKPNTFAQSESQRRYAPIVFGSSPGMPFGFPFGMAFAFAGIRKRNLLLRATRVDRASGAHKATVTPDRVILGADRGIRVQHVRTGRKTKAELEKPIYAFLRLGARLKYRRKSASVETFYLGTRERV